MNIKLSRKKTIVLILSPILVLLFAIGVISYEVITKKEFFPTSFNSAGNCRVSNTIFAVENKYNVHALRRYNAKRTKYIRYLVAVDSKFIVYDFSNGEHIDGNISIEEYMNSCNAETEYILKPNGDTIENNVNILFSFYSKVFIFLSKYS